MPCKHRRLFSRRSGHFKAALNTCPVTQISETLKPNKIFQVRGETSFPRPNEAERRWGFFVESNTGERTEGRAYTLDICPLADVRKFPPQPKDGFFDPSNLQRG